MYERILVAVDGSPVSDRALVEAAKLAQLSGGELRVITIVDSPLRHGSTTPCTTTRSRCAKPR